MDDLSLVDLVEPEDHKDPVKPIDQGDYGEHLDTV